MTPNEVKTPKPISTTKANGVRSAEKRTRGLSRQNRNQSQGTVSSNESYTLDELKRRVGLKDAALRTARKNGLAVHYVSGRGFVLGRDWIAYIVSR